MAAYWIAHVTVKDPQQYKSYMALAPLAFQKYHARFLARGENAETLEGKNFIKHVLIEFEDYQTALACYHSEEYRKAREEREKIAEAMIVIVDGLV